MNVNELLLDKNGNKMDVGHMTSSLWEAYALNGHDYVEIGGIKWATMNVGAKTITDRGLYFQWGDVQGYTADQVGSGDGQKYFGLADYKFCSGAGTSNSGMTKYNSTDEKRTLDIEDDPVRAAWGGLWRLPTWQEFKTLSENIRMEWESNYFDGPRGMGYAGMWLEDINDSSKRLYLPKTSYCSNGKTSHKDGHGNIQELWCYWSSSQYHSGGIEDTQASCMMYGDLYRPTFNGKLDRSCGLSARGVVDF